MEEDRFHDLERRIEALEHGHEVNGVKIDEMSNDIKQLWMFVRVYFTERIRKIGNLQLNKKTLAGLLFSIVIGVVNFLLRLFDVI